MSYWWWYLQNLILDTCRGIGKSHRVLTGIGEHAGIWFLLLRVRYPTIFECLHLMLRLLAFCDGFGRMSYRIQQLKLRRYSPPLLIIHLFSFRRDMPNR